MSNMSRYELIAAGWEPPKDAARLKKWIRTLRIKVKGLERELAKYEGDK